MTPHPIDERSSDRLASGAMNPEDAPPGYEQVARLLRTAQAPAGPGELAREQEIAGLAAAAITAAGMGSASIGMEHRRRSNVISKLGTLRAAAITAAAVLGAGAAAAAATGGLSAHNHGASPAVTVPGTPTSVSTSTTAGVTDAGKTNPNAANPLNLPTTGPANFHAVIGLCRAFLAHNPTTSPTSTGSTGSATGGSDNSTAFQALRKDATGSATGSLTATASWCTAYLAKYSPGNSGAAPNHSSGSGANNGQPGNGQPGNGQSGNGASGKSSPTGGAPSGPVGGSAPVHGNGSPAGAPGKH